MTCRRCSRPIRGDRIVLITGGASGDRRDTRPQLARLGGKVAFLDITDADASTLIESLRLGAITVLIFNAANDQLHDFQGVTVEYWGGRMAVKLRHRFFAIQVFAPLMRAAGGGSVSNFGSTSWRTSHGGMPTYTTAKTAVEGLTKGMTRDLKPWESGLIASFLA